MQRSISVFLIVVLLMTFTACASTQEGKPENLKQTPQAGDLPETPSAGLKAQPENTAGKALVIYFSCTGNTRTMAQTVAELTGAELYELTPEIPYTAEDLNYNNDNSRANREMNDASARPAIAGELPELSGYDTIYIGYPIWWGTMPRILDTFFDSCDLSGKTVLPFCTSGGSGISRSVSEIQAAEPRADVRDGLQVESSIARNCANRVNEWLEVNRS